MNVWKGNRNKVTFILFISLFNLFSFRRFNLPYKSLGRERIGLIFVWVKCWSNKHLLTSVFALTMGITGKWESLVCCSAMNDVSQILLGNYDSPPMKMMIKALKSLEKPIEAVTRSVKIALAGLIIHDFFYFISCQRGSQGFKLHIHRR